MTKGPNRSAMVEYWRLENDEHGGAYAVLVGFERRLRESGSATLTAAYDALDVYGQIALYGFVADLLCEEHDEHAARTARLASIVRAYRESHEGCTGESVCPMCSGADLYLNVHEEEE